MTGVHCLTGEYFAWAKKLSAGDALRYRIRTLVHLQVPSALEPPAENLVGRGAKRDQEKQGLVPDPGPLRGRALQPAEFGLPFHHRRGVEDVQSEVSERELQVRREREEERREEEGRQEAQGLGVGNQEQPLFLRTPSFMVLRERSMICRTPGRRLSLFLFSFVFLSNFLSTPYIFLGQARVESKALQRATWGGLRTGRGQCTSP